MIHKNAHIIYITHILIHIILHNSNYLHKSYHLHDSSYLHNSYSLHNSYHLHNSYGKVNFLKHIKTDKVFSFFFVFSIYKNDK